MILKYKTTINYLFSAIAVALFFGCSNNEKQTVTTKNNLIFQDEFDVDGAPKSANWGFDIGTGNNGWGNNEKEYYTNRPENCKIENGVLKIVARKESFMGAGYTSSRILSKGKIEQKFGRIEARIKVPYGKGLWPAFWLLGADSDAVVWPQCGEVDIMEYLGNNPTTIFGTVHGPGYSGSNAISKNYVLTNNRFDNDFHVFGIEWGQDYVNYYVDDVLYNQITPKDVKGEWVFNKPFYMILNMAVGGNFPGEPNLETIFPATMLVDYVRIYN